MGGYESLRDRPREELWGLLREHDGAGLSRDDVVMRALGAAEEGQPAPPANGPPRWLAGWARDELSAGARRWPTSNFGPVRLLERLRLLTLEHDDDYVLSCVSGFGRARWVVDAPRLDQLRQDPELLQVLAVRLFEVEGGGEVSLANCDRFAGGGTGRWDAALLTLTAEGTLRRAEMLDRSLAACNREMSSFRVAWFRNFFGALHPTIEELADRQSLMMELLDSPIRDTVGWAVKQATVLHRAERLDAGLYLARAPGAVRSESKSTALQALRLAANFAPGWREPAIEAIGWGLEHPTTEVQAKALGMLERLGAERVVAQRSDALAPSLQPTGENSPPVASRTAAAVRPSPSPLSSPGADEALLAISACLEDDGDAFAVERALAGIALLADPADSLRTLIKRAKAVHGRSGSGDSGPGVRHHLAELVLRVCGVEVAPLTSPSNPLVERIAEVGERVRAGDHRPLLATPTDTDGFIDPGALVERFSAEPSHFDLVAALRRVGEAGRESALARAAHLRGEAADALRYALGGDSAPPAETAHAGWWIAAARSRDPLGTDEALRELGFSAPGQAASGSVNLGVAHVEHTSRTGEVTVKEVHLVEPPLGDSDPDAPQRRILRTGSYAPPGTASWLVWRTLDWPHDAELVAAEHYLEMRATSTQWSGVPHRSRPLLERLRAHAGRMGAATAAVIGLGFSSSDIATRVTAVETAAEVLAQGRLTPIELASAMAVCRDLAVPGRWAVSLTELSTLGGGEGAAVVAILGGLLPRLDPADRGLPPLLLVLREEIARWRLRIEDPGLLSWLATLSGKGKTADVVHQLLREHL